MADELIRKTVLLSCGSFNPITNMHLRMFELARDYLTRDARPRHHVVEGIVSVTHDGYRSPSNKSLAPAVDRNRMAELSLQALDGRPHWVRVDPWESQQPRWQRTLTAMAHFRAEAKREDPDVNVMFLCGADLFETFNIPDLWKDDDIRTICGDFGLVVITREGSDPWRTLESSPKAEILRQYKSNIVIVEEKIPNSVSSSAVREALKCGRSVRYLMPDPVLQYIQDKHLYES